MPSQLISIQHEPLYTFLEFEQEEVEEQETQSTEPVSSNHLEQPQIMLAAFSESQVARCLNGEMWQSDLAKEIVDLVNYTLMFGEHGLESYLLQHGKQ